MAENSRIEWTDHTFNPWYDHSGATNERDRISTRRHMNNIGEPVTLAKPQNPWARISDIAVKVGVKPWKRGGATTITATGADGNSYDVWEIIAAVLDKIEDASQPPQSTALDDKA